MSMSNTDTFQTMLLQLRTAFLEEMPEKLDRLEYLLFAMEKNGHGSEVFNELYRTVHSLKGSGGTHGLNIITTICHQLEDLLNTTDGGKKYTPALFSASLKYVDLLRAAREQLMAGNESFPQIETQMHQLRKQLTQKLFTVLLVDNSRLSTNLYLEILSELPLRIAIMNDGLNALRRALTEHFDLIITTNEIPVLNGIGLIGAIKLSDTQCRNIKTILITSNKALASIQKRHIDPDYTIIKDKKMAQNLADTIKKALSIS